jgi:hypothetical protein
MDTVDLSLAQIAHAQATRYVVNATFNQAVLFFEDGSYLQFEHKNLKNRWARASAPQTIADQLGQSLRLFRLNAKHLQLYFEDESDVEFFSTLTQEKGKEANGNPL